ncbi:MAG: glycosidase [Crenarchaeota archaeon]|nr:glycosidase [Thermoproteota archaeon]
MEIPTRNPLEGIKDVDAVPELVQILTQKIDRAYSQLRGLRKPEVRKLFEPLCYISPFDVEIEHPLRKPVALFNPGALLVNERELWVFPRIIPGYFWYPSAIGFFKLNLDKILEGEALDKPIKVSIVVYPRNPWDIGGCEDARAQIVNNSLTILYTGIVPGARKFHVYGGRSIQCLATLDRELKVVRSGFLTIDYRGEKFLPSDWRDSAFVEGTKNEWSFLTRLNIKGVMVCWKSILNVDDLTVRLDTLEPTLVNEPWEYKVGWSTNTVRIGKDEYLVGWHGVQVVDRRYLNGLAIVDSEGNVKAMTNYLLEPSRIEEYYGDRPGVIFGDGLVVHKDLVIWIGGVADQMIGVFVANLDKVMEAMLWIKKR